jgi:hypothetical protein
MAKIVRLTENDLTRLVKRVINEGKDNIKIPNKFKGLKSEVGGSASPKEIISMWNEYVFPDVMGDASKLSEYEDGKFHNEDGESFPVNVILDEINYSLVGDEEDDDEDYDDDDDN